MHFGLRLLWLWSVTGLVILVCTFQPFGLPQLLSSSARCAFAQVGTDMFWRAAAILRALMVPGAELYLQVSRPVPQKRGKYNNQAHGPARKGPGGKMQRWQR